MAGITGHEYPISKIFSEEFDFAIPTYQRPYAWTTEESGELLDDIQSFMRQQSTQGSEDPYFLGSIVLIKKEGSSKAEVIDGQQRLTTLTILLALLAELTSGEDSQALKRYVNEPGNRIEGREPSPRLSLRERDRDFFARYVQRDGGLERLEQLTDDGLTDPRRNIRDNARAFRKVLGKLDAESLVELATFIVKRCFLVAVSTPSMDSAYRIFSVLNDRGLDLLPGDILKAEIIGALTDDDRDRYTKKWEDLEDELGRDSFNELFPHIRMIFERDKLRKTILDAFREQVLPRFQDQRQLIDDVLMPYAGAYLTVATATYRSEQDASDINHTLKWLNQIDNYDWMPPAMEYLHLYRADPSRLERFFHLLERLAASLFIRRKYVNDRIERYGALLGWIEKKKDLYSEGSPLLLSDEEKQETIEQLDGEIYRMNSRALRYVMLRLDSFLSDRAAIYDVPILSVEHVLPQTVAPGSEWARLWPNLERRAEWVHRVGNLLLLTRRKNAQASNHDFADKKERYFRTQGGVTTFALTTKVLEHSSWTPEIVEKRQRALVDCFKKGWDL